MAIASSRLRPFLVGPGLVLLHFIILGESRANVGPPASGGQIVAEPIGIKDIAIAHETLTIDLRPLGTNGRARVEAVYQLQNRGAEKKLDLLFASGSADVSDFYVWLDDQPVAQRRPKERRYRGAGGLQGKRLASATPRGWTI